MTEFRFKYRSVETGFLLFGGSPNCPFIRSDGCAGSSAF